MLIWNRLRYVLSPQFDIYESVAKVVRGKVADIGFGTGFGAHLFVVNGKQIFGYEIDEQAIRFAERAFPMSQIYFRFGDIEKGIDDGGFDFVVMIDVLEHTKDDQKTLLNVKKMMAPSGSFIMSTPNMLCRYRRSEDHVREYGPKDLERLLKQVFVNVSLRNHVLDPIASRHENPIVAICRNDK